MLKLLDTSRERPFVAPCEALADHMKLLDGYFLSYKVRNLSELTLKKEKAFLLGWFLSHGLDYRPLYTWEAMDHLTGRKQIVDYCRALVDDAEVATDTVRSYLGILRRYFAFILEHPILFISETDAVRIQDKYGVLLVQPVSEFDMPRYVYDGERKGVPLDPEKLYEFYSVLRQSYVKGPHLHIKQRNYAMAVLAGETGLRIDELLSLEVSKDLFFESKKIQTREAKAAKGSGKRSRLTLFPPLARDTLKFYIEKVRPKITKSASDMLFASKTGAKLSYTNTYLALRDMVHVANTSGFAVQNHLGWHWFRRIFATRFIEKFPARLPVLVGLLGHMSPNTVHRYIRHSEAWMDKEIIETLSGVEKWLSFGD